VQNFERYPPALRVSREKNPGVSAPADLSLDLISSGERLAQQRQHITPNERILEGDSVMVNAPAG
jgi:hypothetical protein